MSLKDPEAGKRHERWQLEILFTTVARESFTNVKAPLSLLSPVSLRLLLLPLLALLSQRRRVIDRFSLLKPAPLSDREDISRGSRSSSPRDMQPLCQTYIPKLCARTYFH